ncbi:hypothetical protein FB45DRAFT_947354 [Roridomyces roridus]|uniref:Uncharacterized protein n=1 Tax=Roridomyces roridus TaxID=1738132 RepID=A0AAD7FA25_9AGAR|nr:hypothetical protein FB45DRAFT_947354 [Roridomyces roridus]
MHSNLRRLHLGRFDTDYYYCSAATLLRRLELPSLDTLSVSGSMGDVREWLNTFPAPVPLRTLRIYTGYMSIRHSSFDCFPEFGLTDLEVISPEPRTSILDILSTWPDFFPELRNLVVLENVDDIENWQQHVLKFLAIPRSALESLRLRVHKDLFDKYVTVGFVEAVRYEAGWVRVSLESADDYCAVHT